jgi:hypothetical protein
MSGAAFSVLLRFANSAAKVAVSKPEKQNVEDLSTSYGQLRAYITAISENCLIVVQDKKWIVGFTRW